MGQWKSRDLASSHLKFRLVFLTLPRAQPFACCIKFTWDYRGQTVSSWVTSSICFASAMVGQYSGWFVPTRSDQVPFPCEIFALWESRHYFLGNLYLPWSVKYSPCSWWVQVLWCLSLGDPVVSLKEKKELWVWTYAPEHTDRDNSCQMECLKISLGEC
jgi:hypothetical protein